MHGTCETYRLAIRPLDDELVLEHNEVALAGGVRHECPELGAKRVEQVPVAHRRLLVREEPDPAQARDDAVRLTLVGERVELLHARDECAVSASPR